jgi:hypothetical protein
MNDQVIPDSEVVLDSALVQESTNPTIPNSDIIPDSEVNFSLDQTDPEVIANAANKKEEEIGLRHGKFGQLGAALEGVAESGTFGLSTKAETALGVPAEEIRQRREDYPVSHGVGEIAGLINPLGPEAKILGAAGKLGADLVRGSSFLSKVGRGAVKGAIENGMFQAGDEVSKKFAEDPNQTAETAITDIGLSSLIGGGLGGMFGAVHPLWENSKASKFVDEMKSRFNEHLTNPDLPTKAADDLAQFHTETNQGSNDLFRGTYDENGVRTSGVKDQAIDKLVPEINEKIVGQTSDLGESIGKRIDKMRADPDMYPKRLVNPAEQALSAWSEKVSDPSISSGELFRANEDLKRSFQELSRFDKLRTPVGDDASIKMFKGIGADLRKSLEDTEVWGEAGKFQKETNQAFSEFLGPLKDFNKSFAAKIENEYKVDPDKVQSYLNQAAKEKGAIRGEKLQNYLDAATEYRDAINNAHEKIGAPAPFEHKSAEAINPLNKLTPGAKAADAIVKNMIEHSAGEAAGAIGGSIAGWPGYMIGKHIAGPILDRIMPKLIKPVLGSAADGTALKTSLDYIAAFAKGETQLNKGISNVFKAGKEVLPQSIMPTEKDRSKLNKTVQDLASNPEPLLNVGGKTAHYLPEHGQALSQTAANAINYINSQRPVSPKISPLDSPSKPDPMQQSMYNRVLDIAQQPLSILPHIKEGTLQPKDVEAMQNLYPALYQKISSQMISEISSLPKDSVIPYKTKMGMSLFLGKAMDSTMLPQSILATQPVPQQAPQQPTKSGGKSETSLKAMKAVSQAAMTPDQARSASRSMVKS